MATETSPVFPELLRVRLFLAAFGPAGTSCRSARRPRAARFLLDRLKESAAEEGPQRGQNRQQGGQRKQQRGTGRDDSSGVVADHRALAKHPKHNELCAKG